ncbi:DNA/RNA helicase, superfamily II, SNF2 family [Spongiibacter sp. IMCC21906]|uniref:RNA polymerase-associated protein RapA n=1 Tax=Spongiibacter sp. IMCC21906 TaxID=1620392 RepID=UPI00062DFE10|nr:RNA polymerase-associated protein RapA [Spongiibacter sp. IMCC21906]AKH69364.1 DNA/RNA helicase, superfamily II, SNF2 family [Spongiibacter sp. IMCC21906]
MSLVFLPGQRWISNPEPDLGLGIILEAVNRRVVIAFPAAEEERTYAAQAAPLSRVQFQNGDEISVPDQGRLVVTDQQEHNGCIVYFAEDDQGEIHPVPEQILSAVISLSGPKERMLAGQLEHPKRFELRAATLEQRNTAQAANTFGLLGPRVQLLPHQLYLAKEIASRPQPRALLADEVGLGKTIEAGLIIHQLLLSERAKRVLVMVPDSLVHQWLVEMLRRFNLHFTVLDEARCALGDEPEDLFAMDDMDDEPDEAALAALESKEDNPFESAQLVICSVDWLTDDVQRRQQALDAGWDVMVVDEAHHLDWQEDGSSSAEYQCVEQFAGQIASVLLLTATPENTGVEGHFARLRLLDPERFSSLTDFKEEQAAYEGISDLIQGLLDAPEQNLQDKAFCTALADYLDDEQLTSLQNQADAESIDNTVRDLLDRFGTGRLLFRNTRNSVGGFPARQLQAHPLAAPADYVTAAADASLTELLRPEQLLGDNWLKTDPRVQWLEKYLLQLDDEKVLLICADANTAQDLELYLRIRRGIPSALFFEGLSLLERDRAAAYFADPEDGAQLLVCSEIGSEGRNFQFAQHLVLFDLPLNPDLLEQRIGRLDRIGQQGDIQLHVPYYQDSAQQRLLSWYNDALGIFQSPCTIGDAMMTHFGSELQQELKTASANFDALLSQAKEQAQNLRDSLSRGRNRLLELNSCKPDEARALVEQLEAEQRSDALASYIEIFTDQFGLEHEEHSENAVILRPGDHMQIDALPFLPEEGITGTFDRDRALSREDMAYFSWEHPLVRSAMDIILSGDFGSASLCTLPVKGLKPGTLLLEVFFNPALHAPAWLQLQRQLPAQSLRLVIDNDLRDLSKGVAHSKLNQLCKSVKKTLAPALLREVRESLGTMIQHLESQAKTESENWQQQALANYRQERDQERQRMVHLMDRNPDIDDAALAKFDDDSQRGEDALSSLKLNMAALRLAVVS